MLFLLLRIYQTKNLNQIKLETKIRNKNFGEIKRKMNLNLLLINIRTYYISLKIFLKLCILCNI